jgi:hypothetical protein
MYHELAPCMGELRTLYSTYLRFYQLNAKHSKDIQLRANNRIVCATT